MPKGDKDKSIRCSFCGKTQEDVERIIAGPGVYICDECIKVCTNIIENDLYEDSEITYELESPADLPKPEEIKDILEKLVEDSATIIMVPNLEHLKKGGRITPAVAALAGLLKIVPIMKLNYSLGGKIDSFGKVRTTKKANLKIIDHMVNECKVNNKDYVFAIEHVLNEELALEMKQKLIEQIGECEILVRELPAVVGAHMGIGGIGYQYIRKYEE